MRRVNLSWVPLLVLINFADAQQSPVYRRQQLGREIDGEPQQKPVFRPATVARNLNCPAEMQAFELVTGSTMRLDVDTRKSNGQLADPTIVLKETRMLKHADCLAKCKADAECQSVNYETGLCVMLRENAEARNGKTTFNLEICY
jgi:hypothetical protein